MKRSRLLAVFAALLMPGAVLPQEAKSDTILLINGQQFVSPVIDTSFFGVKILRQKKKRNKEMIIEGERIFSVKFAGGGEKIFYKKDTIYENYFTVEETLFFIKGEQDATKNYRCPFTTLSSFAVGAASSLFAPSVIALAPPFAYSASTLIPKIRIRHSTVSNLNYLNYDTYILGYERVARKKRLIQSLKGSVAGLAAGFAGVYVYSNFINK